MPLGNTKFQQQGFLMFWRSLWIRSISYVTFWSTSWESNEEEPASKNRQISNKTKNDFRSIRPFFVVLYVWPFFYDWSRFLILFIATFFRSCHGYRHTSKLLCEITVHKLFYVKKKSLRSAIRFPPNFGDMTVCR